MATFGKLIRDKRQLLNLTQEELAQKIGVSVATVNKYESGVLNNPSRARIDSFARALGCSPMDLLAQDVNSATVNVSFPSGNKNVNIRFTQEEEELLRIFNRLPVRNRITLLNYAYKLEDELGADQ